MKKVPDQEVFLLSFVAFIAVVGMITVGGVPLDSFDLDNLIGNAFAAMEGAQEAGPYEIGYLDCQDDLKAGTLKTAEQATHDKGVELKAVVQVELEAVVLKQEALATSTTRKMLAATGAVVGGEGTCGDQVCDATEQADPTLCPQDCPDINAVNDPNGQNANDPAQTAAAQVSDQDVEDALVDAKQAYHDGYQACLDDVAKQGSQDAGQAGIPCGDNVCDEVAGETVNGCPEDCGTNADDPTKYCGDGTCRSGEATGDYICTADCTKDDVDAAAVDADADATDEVALAAATDGRCYDGDSTFFGDGDESDLFVASMGEGYFLTTGEWKTYEDNCKNDGYVHEAYCRGASSLEGDDYLYYNTVACPTDYVCNAGACVAE
jgi:hypothetical protein